MKQGILDNTLEEFQQIIMDLKQPPYRGRQIYAHALSGKSIMEMHNIPAQLRDGLDREYIAQGAKVILKQCSRLDETAKYLFELQDGATVEGVFMRYKHGATLCLSTQAGCRMGCAFCASTQKGLHRNLTCGEMLSQVIAVSKDMGAERERRAVQNIVLMGSGEPLDNYTQVLRFLKTAISDKGLNIGARHISLSTCGIPERIRALADEQLGITLSLSLHAPNDAIRTRLMPVARRYAMEDVLGAMGYYTQKTGRRSIVEYILIKGVNDAPEHARELAERLQSYICHVNLIPFNPVEGKAFIQPDAARIDVFLDVLRRHGVSATLRRSLGNDILGACGQLRNRFLQPGGMEC